VASEKPKNGGCAGAKNWFVRNEQGGRFGPVDFETVKAWACDGRIGPSNEISENGVDWQLAIAHPELDMDWVAEVTPGNFYGPIHRSAMASLVGEGSIAKQAPLFLRSDLAEDRRADTRKEAGPSADEMAALEAGRLEAESRAAAAENLLADMCRRLDELQAKAREESDALVSRLRESDAAGAAHAETAEQLRGELSRQADETRRLAEDADSRLRQMQASLHAGVAERDELRQQLAEQASAAKRFAEELEARLEEAQTRIEAGAAERAAISKQASEKAELLQESLESERQRVAELTASLGKASAEVASLSAQVEALRAESTARETAWQSERQQLESSRQSLQAEVNRALEETAVRTSRIAALESELSKAERDARLREQGGESEARELRGRLREAEAEVCAQRVAVQRAQAECAALKTATDKAVQERIGEQARLADMSRELGDVRQQVEALRLALADERAVRVKAAAEPVILDAEPVDAPRSHAKSAKPKREHVVVEAEVVGPEGKNAEHKRPFPKSAGGHDKKAGLSSLAELEQQARRELERLGAQGPSFFMRKR